MPQLGFLIAVNLDPDTGTGIYYGQYHHEGEWTMCFTSEDAVYYKNQLMFDLDSQYGDLPSRIAGKSASKPSLSVNPKAYLDLRRGNWSDHGARCRSPGA